MHAIGAPFWSTRRGRKTTIKFYVDCRSINFFSQLQMIVPPPTGLKTLETPRPFIAVSLRLYNVVDMKSMSRLGQIYHISKIILLNSIILFSSVTYSLLLKY